MATQLRAEDEAHTTPLALVDVTDPALYGNDGWRPWSHRLRAQAQVHHCADSPFGPYRPISGHADIQAIEARPDIFHRATNLAASRWSTCWVHSIRRSSSPWIGRAMANSAGSSRPPAAPVKQPGSPAQSAAVPPNCSTPGPSTEQSTGLEKLSIEPTTGLLAILFDYPWADRHLLTLWSDWGGDHTLCAGNLFHGQAGLNASA
jgi:hypothetical protein